MKNIYIFTGLPGSGKSSTSKVFAERWKLPRVSRDDEQVALFEQHGFHSNDEKKVLLGRVDEIVFSKISDYLSTGENVVLDQWIRDSNFLDKMCREFKAKIFLIYIRASAETITDRYNNRSRPLCMDAINVYPVVEGVTTFWPKKSIEKNIESIKEYESFLETLHEYRIIKVDSDNASVNEEVDFIERVLKEEEGIRKTSLGHGLQDPNLGDIS